MNYYFHFPFCASKCGYCAFYSIPGASGSDMDAWLDCVERKLSGMDLEPARTIYIGGGTPTLASARQLARLFNLLERFGLLSDAEEVSMEANPETLSPEKIALLRRFVSRISVGVQSFNSSFRKVLGRNCSDRALLSSLESVSSAGFPHFNCDLIYNIPGQCVDDWCGDLRKVAALPVDHVSCYSLTVEESCRLSGKLSVDDDLADDMYDVAERVLAEHGLARYEISNYAKRGGRCRHNCGVWAGERLVGVGPSAAGFDGHDRMTEVADFRAWQSGSPAELDAIGDDARREEIFAVNLRTVDGWTRQLWEAVEVADGWESRLNRAGEVSDRLPGCLLIRDDRISLSDRGLRFWNQVAEEFLL